MKRKVLLLIIVVMMMCGRVDAMVQWFDFSGLVSRVWENTDTPSFGVGDRFTGKLQYDAGRVLKMLGDAPEFAYSSPILYYSMNIGGHLFESYNRGFTTIYDQDDRGIDRLFVGDIGGGVSGDQGSYQTESFFTFYNSGAVGDLDLRTFNSPQQFASRTVKVQWAGRGQPFLPDFEADIDQFTESPVPEPATLILLGSGLLGAFGFKRRWR